MPPYLIPRLRWSSSSISGAFVGIAGALPSSAIVLNRTIGLGMPAPASEDDVARIVAAYARAGVARYLVHCHPDATPPELPGWLQATGLVRARGWQKFERGPGRDGVSITQQLKAAQHLADIPIIMMTGDARRETLLSSMEAGAAAFVVKPFTRESLTANLEKVLAR